MVHCEAVYGITAIEKAEHDPLYNRTQSPMLMLVLFLIDGEKRLPVILEESVEGAAGKPPRMVGHSRMVGTGGLSGGTEDLGWKRYPG